MFKEEKRKMLVKKKSKNCYKEIVINVIRNIIQIQNETSKQLKISEQKVLVTKNTTLVRLENV